MRETARLMSRPKNNLRCHFDIKLLWLSSLYFLNWFPKTLYYMHDLIFKGG